MAHHREQPAGPVLSAHPRRTQAARGRDGRVGPRLGGRQRHSQGPDRGRYSMSLLTDAMERLKGLFFRGRREQELAEELRDHIERETQERIRRGERPEAARRAALLAFGGVEQTKEAVRDARGIRPLEELGADLRYALRGLRRNPGFTATCLLYTSPSPRDS